MKRLQWLMPMVLIACGPDEPAAQLSEVCGADGPVRVLALEPGEVVSGSVTQFGDRSVFTVVHHMPTEDSEYQTMTLSGVWTTGPCGESPVKIDADVRSPYTLDHWPDVLLARSADLDTIYAIDPLGEAPANPVFTGVTYYKGVTAAGVIAAQPVDVNADDLYLHPYPEDPRSETAKPVLLFAGLAHRDISPYEPNNLVLFDDVLYVRTSVADLVQVRVPDGEVTVLQTGVWDFEVAPDQRHILWQDIKPIESEIPESPIGEVFLRDMSDGTNTALGPATVGSGSSFLSDEPNLFLLLSAPGIDSPRKLYRLDTLAAVDLPDGSFPMRFLPDGQWLLGNILGVFPFSLFDPVALSNRELQHSVGSLEKIKDDGLEILDIAPLFTSDYEPYAEGPLWFVPFDGSAPKQIAETANRSGVSLENGHRVDSLDLDDDLLGRLVLQDGQSTAQIDDRVYGEWIQLSLAHEGAILYSVDDGERSGVWLARPEQTE